MKLYLQQVIAAPREVPGVNEFISIQEKMYKEIALPDTEIIVNIPSTGMLDPDLNVYTGLRAINDIALVKSMVEAEKEGADVIVVNCWFDSGVETARQLVKIPVVGVCEASMHLAAVMGTKFAAITSQPEYVPSMEVKINRCKMDSNAIDQPVRATLLGLADELEATISGKYDPVVEDFVNIARKCISDGAEVIICGCALLAPLLTLAGLNEVDDVPVINPVSVGVKWAEMLVGLQKAGISIISRKGLNLIPSREQTEELLKSVCI